MQFGIRDTQHLVQLSPYAVQSQHCQHMSQGEDPGTDFRGAGLFGLDNLVYLGTHHPELFRQLRHKTRGQRADWEYPFAVAGLNLTFTLADVLGIAGSNPGKLPSTPAGEAETPRCLYMYSTIQSLG